MRERGGSIRDRRNALTKMLRWGAYGLCGVGGGFLLATRSKLTGRTDCAGNGFCRECGLWDGCELPAARSFRESAKEQEWHKNKTTT